MRIFGVEMSDLWVALWSYKISLVPVLLTYFLFDFIAIVRKLTGVAYVPIYFVVFPIGHTDQLYAEYLNEDDFYCVGVEMSSDQKERLRYKIMALAIVSMACAAVIAPAICGAIAATYLDRSQFLEFLIFLLIVKSYMVIWSLWNLRQQSRALSHRLAVLSVVGIYTLYLLFVWLGLNHSFEWASAHLSSKGGSALLLAIWQFIYRELILNILLVAALTWALTVLFTRRENITPADKVDDGSIAYPEAHTAD